MSVNNNERQPVGILRKIGLLALAMLPPIIGVIAALKPDSSLLLNAAGIALIIGYVGVVTQLARKGKLPTRF